MAHPANLEGWHPEDVIELRDPALTELLGTRHHHRYDDDSPVAVRENNNRRAGWALIGINAYSQRVHGDSVEPLRTGIVDFLGDFLHLCDLLNLDFDGLVADARRHYEPELAGEL